MAFVTDYRCNKCGKTGKIAVGAGQLAPNICTECDAKEKDIKRRTHFSDLDGLTIEERLRRVEEWIYDYKIPISIRDVRF